MRAECRNEDIGVEHGTHFANNTQQTKLASIADSRAAPRFREWLNLPWGDDGGEACRWIATSGRDGKSPRAPAPNLPRPDPGREWTPPAWPLTHAARRSASTKLTLRCRARQIEPLPRFLIAPLPGVASLRVSGAASFQVLDLRSLFQGVRNGF